MDLKESLFIKACYCRNDGPIPIWIMRQAGRYLPEYRAVREKTSFQELCRSPQLIAEVVRQPVERFGLDASILFSDILTLLEPMGAQVEFPEGGPRILNRIENPDDVYRLKSPDIDSELSFVFDGINRIKQTLPSVPLIGFAGSPFTLACYLIEGGGSKNFDRPKRFLHEHPGAAVHLFDLLTESIARYLLAQVDAGADAIQLFDSWGGVLSHDDYRTWSAAPINRILARLRECKVPRLLFVNNVVPYLDIVRDIECEVVGVDYRADLCSVARALPGKAIQGNLDPSSLFGSVDRIVERTEKILGQFEQPARLVFNLGHGIQPGTPVESVEAMVNTVHRFRS